MFDNLIPYTNIHEMNLDWIIAKVKEYVQKTEVAEINYQALKSYVENYFDDLDVQEEINNKLDDMYQNGQLAVLIAQFLNTQSLIVFNNIADLKSAENLVDGVTAMTIGEVSYNDGQTHLYKIRNIVNTDVVDDYRIIPLTNYPSLIGELLPVNSDPEYLFIGDSYLKYGDGSDPTVNITNYLPNYMGLNADQYVVSANGGASFTRENNTFLMLLNSASASITHPNLLTDIVVIGGYNEQYETYANIDTAIELFCSTAKTLFPNAKVSLAFVGWTRSNDSTVKKNLIRAIRAWQGCGKYGARYITNSECINHDYSLYNGTVHPNSAGAQNMARYLASALNGSKSCDVIYTANPTLSVPGGETNVTAVSGNIEQYLHNNILSIVSTENIGITLDTYQVTGSTFNIAELDVGIQYSIPEGLQIPVNGIIRGSNGWQDIQGYLRFSRQVLQFTSLLNVAGVTALRIAPFTYTVPTILN